MLVIDVPSAIYEKPGTWNGTAKQMFRSPEIHLEMEHSLLSISKWEAKWKVPFIEQQQISTEQFLDYCRCMTINKQKDPSVYHYLRAQDAKKISAYMNDPMSARPIRRDNKKKRGPKRVMSSEYFYWCMIQLGIPFECEKWHFGRLLALIDCCQKNSGSEPPMSYRERQRFYASLNDQRRAALGTKG